MGTVVGGAAFAALVHLFVFGLYKFRVFLSAECCGKSPYNEMDALFWKNSKVNKDLEPKENPVYTIYAKEMDKTDGTLPRDEDEIKSVASSSYSANSESAKITSEDATSRKSSSGQDQEDSD